MEIKINIQKGHLWIIVLLLIGIAFVIGQGTLTPQQFGHTSNQITVNYNGESVTLQEAINQISSAGSGFQLVTGTYTGNGATSRFIEVSNINAAPSMVWVVSNVGHGPPIYRIGSQNLHGDVRGSDDNYKWMNMDPSTAGDNLKGVEQNGVYGFIVSNGNLQNGFTTNTLNHQYSYFVIVPSV